MHWFHAGRATGVQRGRRCGGSLYTSVMSVTVDLSDEVLRRLEAEAARRGVAVESLIAETLERDFPAATGGSPTLSFIGIAEAREDLSENYKQIRRDLAAGGASDA